MVRHIVFWKLRDDVTGQARAEALATIKAGFEAMQGQVPGLLKIEVGVPFSEGAESADLALYTEFESRTALRGYDAHPLHQSVGGMVREIRVERRVADYEV